MVEERKNTLRSLLRINPANDAYEKDEEVGTIEILLPCLHWGWQTTKIYK